MPPEKVTTTNQFLRKATWGSIVTGTFHGMIVAVRHVYPRFNTTVRQEIRTMAHSFSHPNLLIFMGAVIDEEEGHLLITELVETTLRAAYQANQIGPNKRQIFEDVSLALDYLHQQIQPIVHRDVSTYNILLTSRSNMWRAKLGLVNLTRYAVEIETEDLPYLAPEVVSHSTALKPHLPETTKSDVYSFGVVMCEVATETFPEGEMLPALLTNVGQVWSQISPLINSCIDPSPEMRPTMDMVFKQIKQLDWEP